MSVFSELPSRLFSRPFVFAFRFALLCFAVPLRVLPALKSLCLGGRPVLCRSTDTSTDTHTRLCAVLALSVCLGVGGDPVNFQLRPVSLSLLPLLIINVNSTLGFDRPSIPAIAAVCLSVSQSVSELLLANTPDSFVLSKLTDCCNSTQSPSPPLADLFVVSFFLSFFLKQS